MGLYMPLSLTQAIVIIICGASVLDYGMDIYGDPDEEFGINEAIFGEDDQSAFWNPTSFWGYCFIVVGILQMVKALTVKIE